MENNEPLTTQVKVGTVWQNKERTIWGVINKCNPNNLAIVFHIDTTRVLIHYLGNSNDVYNSLASYSISRFLFTWTPLSRCEKGEKDE